MVVLSVDFLSPLLMQLGAGGVGGFLVGYSLKRVAKFLAIVVGGLFVLLQYLAWQRVIEIHYGALFSLTQDFARFFDPSGFLGFVLANVPFAGSFAAGFALGVKAA